MKLTTHKYCIVPKCKNTNVNTPNKLFFNLPRDDALRKKWCDVMKRDCKTPLSSKSVLYCCEDHFDVETDMESFIKYKMVGGQLRLKKGVIPHKFDCQIDTLTSRETQMQKRIDELSQSLNIKRNQIRSLQGKNSRLEKKVLMLNKKVDALSKEVGNTEPNKNHERKRKKSTANKGTKMPVKQPIKSVCELDTDSEGDEKNSNFSVHTVIVKEEDFDTTLEEEVLV